MNDIHTGTVGEPAASAVLDVRATGQWLSTALHWPHGWEVGAVRVGRLWPGRHGKLSFELVVHITRDDESRRVPVQGVCGASAADHRDTVVLQGSTAFGLAVANPEIGVACFSPDCDPCLPVVTDLLDPQRAATVLLGTVAGRRLGLDHGAGIRTAEVTAYRVNKRCMLSVKGEDAECGVFVKVLRRLPPEDIVQAQRRLRSWLRERSAGRIAIPTLLDIDRDRGFVVHEAIQGATRSLTPAEEDLAFAAETLALLHDAPVHVERVHQPDEEVRIASRWIAPLEQLGHPLAAELRERVSALTGYVQELGPPRRTVVHRDFHTKQVLCAAGRAWLVDFDTLSLGDAEVDLSTGCSHLMLDLLRAGVAAEAAESRMHDFVEAYRRHGGKVDDVRLRFYVASALTRLGAIHAARGLPLRSVRSLWAAAERRVDGGSS